MSNSSTSSFKFKNQIDFYQGKVRDVYIFDKKLVIIASNRVSAFDTILPEAIPFKGQVLNQISLFFMKESEDIVKNWVETSPYPHIAIGKKCQALPVEMVIRGYLAGSAWRAYRDGERVFNDYTLPEGLKENDKLPEPIITPSTKAEQGKHDEDIDSKDIIATGLVEKNIYDKLEDRTFNLFDRGSKIAQKQGLILADTKYEFGLLDNEVYLIDEIHTPDSSRYFDIEGYEERQKNNQKQPQRSKEMLRQWLIEQGFQGREGEQIPEISQEWINTISQEYISIYEQLTGQQFKPFEGNVEVEKIEKYLA